MNFSRLPRASDFTSPVEITVKKSSQVEAIRAALTNGCDRPLTPFVMISRAARIASDRRAFNSEDVADALYEELTARGWLISEEDVIEETES